MIARRPPAMTANGRFPPSFRVLLLEMGADDYVVKPFGFREPLALYRFGPHIAESVTRLQRDHRVDLARKTEVRHWISTKESLGVHLTNNKLVVAGSVVR
ncbi:hypothetical protein [Amycolatopsis pigmentata]|uniref:Response regulatory domain-containing protein n=1 Tax=Amycolatopsis pigmentata TaxID=450801 RepID=A0ABW5G239_9PSEU